MRHPQFSGAEHTIFSDRLQAAKGSLLGTIISIPLWIFILYVFC